MRRPVPLKLARSVGLALAAAGLLASAAQAQTATNVATPAPVKTPGVDAPPLPGTPRPLTVPQFEEAT
ncbi:hypothetical protein, partial [Ideonella sp.]|uniref:hypothetical protein n=1 Tax=Ideonella sp. TaxID=1929293 RepID=UPI003BB776D1